ncbi:kinesin-like protein KIN-1 [Lolium rigidum]|uniref:kinesin-like protein KIN-1 n=1 Tax=Lolium rigidum TaxID=89674 RepID=UPI001F5CB3CF|nr:kinesin-like protein KIN-1 [Lolium rigidum]
MSNSNVTVCVRFRPLGHKERKGNDDKVCFKKLDSESFVFKDERDEDVIFSFDKVFYDDSEQSDVYNFLAMPIVTDAVNGINGTIITYGQTGAGKTYSMEGPSILHCNELKTGLVQRVVNGLFDCLRTSENITTWTVKLSMVEIYLEKVRDLLDLSKDNLQIKESKSQGIFISGATEISIMNGSDALERLSHGSTTDERVRTGKIILVDLAGSEKVEKTGAEGRVLDEAKMINKSLSALGNVINALTTAKPNHVPYRDSKLTRILQDSLFIMSLWQYPSRTKLIKTLHKLIPTELDSTMKHTPYSRDQDDLRDGTLSKAGSSQSEASYPSLDSGDHDGLRERLLSKLRLSLKEGDVDLLEELFVLEGIIFDPDSVVLNIDSACHDDAGRQVASLVQAVEELTETVQELTDENETLRHQLEVAQEIAARVQCAATDRSGGLLFGFVPAAVLRLVGFMPD